MAHEFIETNADKVVSEFSRYNAFGVDLETTGLNPIDSRMLLMQISFPDGMTYVIDCNRVKLDPLLPFLSSNKWLKIFQNGKFDTKFVLHEYGIRTNNIFDTYLAENLIYSSQNRGQNGLAALALKYLDIKMDKDIRKTFGAMRPMQAFSEEQIGYAAEDAEVLFGIYKQQEAKLKALGMTRIAEIEFELAPVVGDMELVGVPIDKAVWLKKIEDYKEEHETSRLKMHELLFDDVETDEQLGMFVRDAINLNSPKQVKEAFKKIGIDVDSTDERTIALVNHPAAKELLNYRKLQKILTSYGTSFIDKIHPFTNRIHADFQQLGTETGRFSCKEPNLQQMPEEFRKCVSSPDHDIIVCDFSQIELRILAELSDDPVLIQAFSTGHDPHISTAALMFNIPIETVTKEQRYIAKTINFGIAYGMGPYKLMDMLNSEKEKKDWLPFNRVAGMLSRYKETYRKANEWLNNAGNLAYRQGYSSTMLGRRRFYTRPDPGPDFEKQVSSIRRQGANSPIQGTNADITKLSMLNLYRDLKTYGFSADMIIQVHDEIVVLAHKKQAESVKEVVEESMISSAQEVLKKVPVLAEAKVSTIWEK